MESVIWNVRTLDDFVLGAPFLQLLLFVLVVFWDYPLLVCYFLALLSDLAITSPRGAPSPP